MTRAFTGTISTLEVVAFVFGAGVSFAADMSATLASPSLQTLAAEPQREASRVSRKYCLLQL